MLERNKKQKITKFSISRNGFTLFEILVVIAIMIILIAMSVTAFVKSSSYHNLNKESEIVYSYVNNAREKTISSTNNTEYGILFATTSVTLFEGRNYNGPTTTVYTISSPTITISNINLTANVKNFYFKKITGEPTATGTIIIKNSNDNSTKTITIKSTGLIQIQ